MVIVLLGFCFTQHCTGGGSTAEEGSTNQEDILNIEDGHFTWSRPREDKGDQNDETVKTRQAHQGDLNETLEDHSPTAVWVLIGLNLRIRPVSDVDTPTHIHAAAHFL